MDIAAEWKWGIAGLRSSSVKVASPELTRDPSHWFFSQLLQVVHLSHAGLFHPSPPLLGLSPLPRQIGLLKVKSGVHQQNYFTLEV